MNTSKLVPVSRILSNSRGLPSFLSRSLSTKSKASSASDIYVPSTKLANKVAIVTASTQGIGFSIARKLATDGAKVVISSRKEENVNEALAKLKSYNLDVAGLTCHVGKEEDRQRVVDFTIKQYGKIDFLISNAAANPHMGDILDITESQYDKIFDINVKSAFMLTQKIVPHMKKNGPDGGSIVFVGSIAGYVPFPMIGMYSVSKTALLGLTKVLSSTLAQENIRVNNIVPGLVETKFSEILMNDEVAALADVKRFGQPDELGGIVSFLCSKEASFVTGESICVTGGFPSRL